MIEIVETGNIGIDGSIHNVLKSDVGGIVEFADMADRICAHSWFCPGEGRLFLKKFEEMATNTGRKLEIPNVINTKLQKILEDNGYVKEQVPFAPEASIDDLVDLWVKNS